MKQKGVKKLFRNKVKKYRNEVEELEKLNEDIQSSKANIGWMIAIGVVLKPFFITGLILLIRTIILERKRKSLLTRTTEYSIR
jgi:hypothetical protein